MKKKNFVCTAECGDAVYRLSGCFCGGDAACEDGKAADERSSSVYNYGGK